MAGFTARIENISKHLLENRKVNVKLPNEDLDMTLVDNAFQFLGQKLVATATVVAKQKT